MMRRESQCRCRRNLNIPRAFCILRMPAAGAYLAILREQRSLLNRLIDRNCTGFVVGLDGGIFTNPQIP